MLMGFHSEPTLVVNFTEKYMEFKQSNFFISLYLFAIYVNFGLASTILEIPS